MASASTHEAPSAPAATSDAHPSRLDDPRRPESDGPTPGEVNRSKVLIASLIVLAAVIAVIVTLH